MDDGKIIVDTHKLTRPFTSTNVPCVKISFGGDTDVVSVDSKLKAHIIYIYGR